ncbi:MAG: oxygenase MpaB family protein [Fluviibacter sp.]
MINNLIRESIRSMIGTKGPPIAFLEPKGDRGLFGPESIAWRIHEDFISMMIGGISSLILQALHPKALAGVWDHSTFRDDLKGRLGRTAFFIAATTYGPKAMANHAIDRVNEIHKKVTGIDELGQPYQATDPHLLRWVHITETRSFMSAFECFRDDRLSAKHKDEYFKEMARLGLKMGATDLPITYRDTESAIASYIPELHYGERARVIIHLLENFPSKITTKPFINLVSRAGFANLPEWVYPIIKKPIPSKWERFAIEKSIKLVGIPIREALKDGVAAHSYRRVYPQSSLD